MRSMGTKLSTQHIETLKFNRPSNCLYMLFFNVPTTVIPLIINFSLVLPEYWCAFAINSLIIQPCNSSIFCSSIWSDLNVNWTWTDFMSHQNTRNYHIHTQTKSNMIVSHIRCSNNIFKSTKYYNKPSLILSINRRL